MDRRPLPLARAIACACVVVSVLALAGCGSDRRLNEEAAAAAESGVATSLEITSTQMTDLLATRTAVSEISTEDIVAIFLTDARGYEDGLSEAVKTRALFELTENGGLVTFSVFFKASVYRASGLSNTSQSRHSCGEITGRFGEDVLSVSDLDCPPELTAAAGENSLVLSMTENAQKYGVNVGEDP